MNESMDPTLRCATDGCQWHFWRLFRSFRMAIKPGKLLAAWLMVVGMLLSGLLIDALGTGNNVLPDEFERYIEVQGNGGVSFDDWLKVQWDNQKNRVSNCLFRAAPVQFTNDEVKEIVESSNPWERARKAIIAGYDKRLEGMEANAPEGGLAESEVAAHRKLLGKALANLDSMKPSGVFQTALRVKLEGFNDVMTALVDPATLTNTQALWVPLWRTWMLLPWLWHAHPGFLIVWMVIWLAIWTVLGGAISRMAMTEATEGVAASLPDAIDYSRKRWFNYLVTPIAVPVIVAVLTLLLALVGAVCFHWLEWAWGLRDIAHLVGAAAFGLAILLGLIMALLILGWAAGVHLMYPALSAEGTDGFDAISRSFAYLIARPWRFLAYCFISLIYGAATYLFLGIVVYLGLRLAQAGAALWTTGFNNILPPPAFGRLDYQPAYGELTRSQSLAAMIIKVWMYATVGFLAAYAISFYFSITSNIYLLLRFHHDGTDPAQCYRPQLAPGASAEDKVEPADAGGSTDGGGQGDAAE